MATAGAASRATGGREILAAIHGQIEPVRTAPRYIAGMALVALVMVLLPLVYVALIAVVAWLLWQHATHSYVVFQHAHGRNLKGAFFVYIGPLVIGGIVLLFMVKPLFAPRRRETEPLTLDPEQEPLLIAFVNKLCAAVHAPAPREIRVDGEVNASAAFRRGFWSLFGSDLTLTIGLPLVAGMSLRQFAGVLAHEFGHFSQGAGMRLTYIIRSVSFWFVRVVYERDSWDEWLNEQARTSEGWISLLVQLTRGFVWLTRRILWVLMYIGQFVSCFMLRQMEYDADRHEARFAGSDTFQETARRLAELSVARSMAFSDLGRFLDEGRLADDLPALVLANVPQITPEIRKQVLEPMETARTGLFDTHPADRDRVASARLEKTPGIFRLPVAREPATHPDAGSRVASATAAATAEPAHFDESSESLPATVLFRDFAELSREATLRFYAEQLERPIRLDELHPVASLVGAQEIEIQANKALQRYFQGTISPLRPLPVSSDAALPPANAEEIKRVLAEARTQMLALLEAYRGDFKEFDEADTSSLSAGVAEAVYRAGAGSHRKQLQLKFENAEAAAAASEKSRSMMDAAIAKMSAFETAAANRLTAALRLVYLDDQRAASELDGESPAQVARLVPAARLAADLCPDLVTVRNQIAPLSALLSCVGENEKNAALISAIRLGSAAIRERLAAIHKRLAGCPYPFNHAEADMTLDRYVFGFPAGKELPDADEIGAIGSLASDAMNKVFALHHRSLSHLSAVAEKIESGLGLAPLPEPPPAQPENAG